jgi:hypothetical protein
MYSNKEDNGYIYCFSSKSMPGIYKIGMTTRTPEERLKDANSSNTWKPPIPYNIEMSVKVSHPYVKEQSLHKLLQHYGKRIHPRREFFNISIYEVRMFFLLLNNDIQLSGLPYIDKYDYEHIEEEENNEDIEDLLMNNDEGIPYATMNNPFERFSYREKDI